MGKWDEGVQTEQRRGERECQRIEKIKERKKSPPLPLRSAPFGARFVHPQESSVKKDETEMKATFE